MLMLSIIIICLFFLCDGRILLYDTENLKPALGRFDCIYVRDQVSSDHGGSSAGKIPYCRRPNVKKDFQRSIDKCENGGQLKLFVDLLKENVRPSQVLEWNSGIEMADKYAVFYSTNSTLIGANDRQDFLCHCIQSSTFGKYCEYQLTHESNSFEASQSLHTHNRLLVPFLHQYLGDIGCYKTLLCDFGLLCLDWRNICDGEQQCTTGLDEENCDKLEFNECEDGEYRCLNGMCIPEEYWLDGDDDCMDWSDEQEFDFANWCFYEVTTIDCDEHLCQNQMWSCGDGQCVTWQHRLIFQNLIELSDTCHNLRNANYMCELHPLRRSWTLPNGLCWFSEPPFDDPELSLNNIALSNDEKCLYLIRCALSDGYELDCPCNRRNCSNIMPIVCNRTILYRYPRDSLVHPHVLTYYDWTRGFKNKVPGLMLTGGMKCRGYYGSFDRSPEIRIPLVDELILMSPWDALLCLLDKTISIYNSSMKYDDDCWKNSRTFNNRLYAIDDVCKVSGQCISQYRIHDGVPDCLQVEDEDYFIESKDLCSRARKHRFQCSREQPTCLFSFKLGDGHSECTNQHDQYLYGHEPKIGNFICKKTNPDNCQFLKEYIQNSTLNFNTNAQLSQFQYSSRTPFRSYCDSFWDRPGHIDELSQYCKHWICHSNQYQCRTGQCIPFDWVFDHQWDCSDASDEEVMLNISQWSPHNQQLKGLNEKRENCSRHYSQLPFARFCEKEKEFPCLRSNVSDPLNVKLNLPCIPYSKIGDEIEDCYNLYDEKNTFETARGEMWGFSVRCGDEKVTYGNACEEYTEKCGYIYCPNRLPNCSEARDSVCNDDRRCISNGRCNGQPDCLYGEDEYSCLPAHNSREQISYRFDKYLINNRERHRRPFFEKQSYPSIQLENDSQTLTPEIEKNLNNSNVSYSFWCNKGVSIIMFNQTICLCPPAYFGDKCQYFSDRISIVTHLDLSTWPSDSTMIMPILFRIKVYFLFNEILIDHYEFNSNPTIEINHGIKHKFYLIYSRSNEMISHKRIRFRNRTDIEQNHPYSVRFDLYGLYSNQSIPIPLGSWHYPIYFDFLPSFRLATVLRFPKRFGDPNIDPCRNHTCNQNSTCRPVFNKNNSYYCACNSCFYGENCSKYDDTYCSSHSFSEFDERSLMDHPFCVCPLEHFGPRCFLRFTQCDSNSCLNNGKCVYTYESYSGDAFICICPRYFYGDRCEKAKMVIQVVLDTNNITESPRVSTIQFYDVDSRSLELLLRHQQIHEGFPSLISYGHDGFVAPVLSVLKTHYDSIEPEYFIIYIQPNSSLINISSSPSHCPLASTLLQKNDIPDLFEYHQICRNNFERLCFYDNDYLCICTWNNSRVDCFIHNTEIDHCSKCLSNGKCIQGDIHNDKDFVCLCPRCSKGRLCELNMEAFGFTVDSLLVECSRTMKIVYLSMIVIIFCFGLFNNFCSFVTFKRPTPRKFGVGNYLLIITCLNKLSLLCLLVKFIQITFRITNLGSCKTVSYLFSVFTRSTYWLTSWVTINRFLTVIFPVSTNVKNPRVAIGISIVTLVFLLVMHIHEIISYTIVGDSLICVTNFNTHFLSIYNRISTLIHYLVPFGIQVIAITLLIVFAARSRTKATGGKMTFYQHLIKQFQTQKELYLTPIIIILASLPQTILTFSLACTELTIWQRHILIVAYLLSYTPQVLGFILYVLPSTTYRKEFSETSIAKILLSWIFNEKKIKQ